MRDMNFSVAMCVYSKDDPIHFETAANSILNQTVPPSEVVLVVDGPVPEELDKVITSFEQMESFHVIRSKENQGHGNARRIGLAACQNELVAIMDADDISSADRFEKQLAFFAEDADLSIVGGNITEFVGEPENVIGKRVVPLYDSEIKKYLKKRCPMNLVTVMFKKSHIDKAGGFVDWYCEEDYYLWVRMFLAGMKFANTEESLVNVRVGSDMYLRRGGVKYFKSEARLQKYMLQNKVIGFGTYVVNVIKRLIVQVLMPNRMRGWVFKKYARKSV